MKRLQVAAATILFTAALLGPGCDSSNGGRGSETHWLSACDSDATCGGGIQCVCGTCTLPCAAQTDCSPLGASAVCARADAAIQACLGFSPPAASLCLARCTTLSDCFGGSSCISGTCVPNATHREPDSSVPSASGGGGTTGGAAGLGGAEDSGASGASASGGTVGAGGTVSDSSVSLVEASAAGSDSRPPTDSNFGAGGAGGSGQGAGGAGADSAAPNGHGHLVLIGHTYDSNDGTDERILENAVFLTERTGPVRVLEYTEFNGGTAATAEPFLSSYASSIGRALSFVTLADYRNLHAALPGADVLLIYDQSGDPYRGPQVSFIANTWAPDIENFMATGGVVVVLDGGSTSAFATGLYLPVGSQSVGTTLSVEDSGDPIAAGITSPFTSTTGYVKYPRASNGNIVVGTSDNLDPVVLHRSVPAHIGPPTSGTDGGDGGTDAGNAHGHFVLIGHDYVYNDTADQQILENAIFLTERTGTVNVLEYTEGLTDGGSNSQSIDATVHSFVAPYAKSIGRSVTFKGLTDYRNLYRDLPAADVLVIYELFYSSFLAVRFIPYTWFPQMDAFLNAGGVIILCAGSANEMFHFGENVLNFGGSLNPASSVGTTLTVTAPTDLVAFGLPSPFSSTTQWVQYAGLTGGTTVVASTGSLAPVVVHVIR